MPPRKLVSDDDGSTGEDNNVPPPTKKAKTSSNTKDSGVTTSTLASETRPRAVSSKQAALSKSSFHLLRPWHSVKVKDEGRAAAQAAKIEALQKQLAKAKKDAHKAQKGTPPYLLCRIVHTNYSNSTHSR